MFNKNKNIKIPFTKCHANGNDFILLKSNDFNENIFNERMIKKICDRHRGVGADGLFVISPSKHYDFKLDYYNSDGSWESLCANGSRCAVLFMNKLEGLNGDCVFVAGDGRHAATILADEMIAMKMHTPQYKSSLISPEGFAGYFIDTGARHFICESNNLTNDFVYEMGRKIRYSKYFSPKGVNVNFFQLNNKGGVDIKTYEKGVEAIMQSCASGSTAVVFHLSQMGTVSNNCISYSSGGSLFFSFDDNWTDSWVEGPAKILFSGIFLL